jgi:hypothetical protein
LKGIGIGNGWMSPLEQGKYASYLYYHGLLDSEQFFILRDLEDTLIDMVRTLDERISMKIVRTLNKRISIKIYQ